MTFLDLYGTELDRELASEDRQELFTTVRRKAAINAACVEFNRLTECFRRSTSIQLSSGLAIYDLEQSTSGAFLWLTEEGVKIRQFTGATLTGVLEGEDLVREDLVQLQALEPGWQLAAAGTPMKFYLTQSENNVLTLGFYPPPSIPATQTWFAEVEFVATPPTLTGDTEEPFVYAGYTPGRLRPWHRALVHFAAHQLELLRKNYAVADRQREQFAALVADYLQHQRRKGGHTVRLARNYLSRGRGRVMDPRRYP